MIKCIITILLGVSTQLVYGQYFHQILYFFDNTDERSYTFDNNPDNTYDFQVINGEILIQQGDGVLIRWDYESQYGILYVTATNQYGCSSTTNIYMSVLPCDRTTIFVPNSFTPNDNSLNETFKPKGTNIKDYEMVVHNRWGEELFFTRNILVGWDGIYKGKLVQMGVYVYQITYQDHENYYHTVIGKLNLVK